MPAVGGDRHRMAQQADAAAAQGGAPVGLDPLEAHLHPRRTGESVPCDERQRGRGEEGPASHGRSSARTTASATCARTWPIALFSRVGCTRFVSRMT